MKIAINSCFGGFGLSEEAVFLYCQYSGIEVPTPIIFSGQKLYSIDPERDNQILIRVIEELGIAASGMCASLRIVDIPDGIDWEISEYDGYEKVVERHRSWS